MVTELTCAKCGAKCAIPDDTPLWLKMVVGAIDVALHEHSEKLDGAGWRCPKCALVEELRERGLTNEGDCMRCGRPLSDHFPPVSHENGACPEPSN